MSIEAAVYDILKSASAVTALVGGTSAPRIYPLGIPAGKTGAAVVYQQISSIPTHTCDGDGDLRTDRIQVNCWSPQGGSPDDARALAEAVRTALAAASGSHGGVTIRYCSSDDEGDIFDINETDENLTRYGKRQDWEICYS